MGLRAAQVLPRPGAALQQPGGGEACVRALRGTARPAPRLRRPPGGPWSAVAGAAPRRALRRALRPSRRPGGAAGARVRGSTLLTFPCYARASPLRCHLGRRAQRSAVEAAQRLHGEARQARSAPAAAQKRAEAFELVDAAVVRASPGLSCFRRRVRRVPFLVSFVG